MTHQASNRCDYKLKEWTIKKLSTKNKNSKWINMQIIKINKLIVRSQISMNIGCLQTKGLIEMFGSEAKLVFN